MFKRNGLNFTRSEIAITKDESEAVQQNERDTFMFAKNYFAVSAALISRGVYASKDSRFGGPLSSTYVLSRA